jgi:hypothetical protein
MRKRNSEKTNNEEEKAKKKGEREMDRAHDQPERARLERRNAQKQCNGPGPVTIGGCAARSLHRSGWSIGVPPTGGVTEVLPWRQPPRTSPPLSAAHPRWVVACPPRVEMTGLFPPPLRMCNLLIGHYVVPLTVTSFLCSSCFPLSHVLC